MTRIVCHHSHRHSQSKARQDTKRISHFVKEKWHVEQVCVKPQYNRDLSAYAYGQTTVGYLLGTEQSKAGEGIHA